MILMGRKTDYDHCILKEGKIISGEDFYKEHKEIIDTFNYANAENAMIIFNPKDSDLINSAGLYYYKFDEFAGAITVKQDSRLQDAIEFIKKELRNSMANPIPKNKEQPKQAKEYGKENIIIQKLEQICKALEKKDQEEKYLINQSDSILVMNPEYCIFKNDSVLEGNFTYAKYKSTIDEIILECNHKGLSEKRDKKESPAKYYFKKDEYSGIAIIKFPEEMEESIELIQNRINKLADSKIDLEKLFTSSHPLQTSPFVKHKK